MNFKLKSSTGTQTESLRGSKLARVYLLRFSVGEAGARASGKAKAGNGKRQGRGKAEAESVTMHVAMYGHRKKEDGTRTNANKSVTNNLVTLATCTHASSQQASEHASKQARKQASKPRKQAKPSKQASHRSTKPSKHK